MGHQLECVSVTSFSHLNWTGIQLSGNGSALQVLRFTAFPALELYTWCIAHTLRHACANLILQYFPVHCGHAGADVGPEHRKKSQHLCCVLGEPSTRTAHCWYVLAVILWTSRVQHLCQVQGSRTVDKGPQTPPLDHRVSGGGRILSSGMYYSTQPKMSHLSRTHKCL